MTLLLHRHVRPRLTTAVKPKSNYLVPVRPAFSFALPLSNLSALSGAYG